MRFLCVCVEFFCTYVCTYIRRYVLYKALSFFYIFMRVKYLWGAGNEPIWCKLNSYWKNVWDLFSWPIVNFTTHASLYWKSYFLLFTPWYYKYRARFFYTKKLVGALRIYCANFTKRCQDSSMNIKEQLLWDLKTIQTQIFLCKSHWTYPEGVVAHYL